MAPSSLDWQVVTATLSHLIATYGLVAVFLLMAVESCGLPFPSEVIMPVAGVLAATGHLDFVAAVLAGALGNLVGSLAAYVIAARFGTPVLLGPGRWVGFSPHHLELATGWFRRYGLLAVLVGRVLPVVRTYISFPAGLARLGLGPFAALTFIGALPWCLALTAAGYFLGANYDRVSGPIQKVAIVIAVAVFALLVLWYVRGRSARQSGD
jgi:membrane protein DedA with SNARE-associated domain